MRLDRYLLICRKLLARMSNSAKQEEQASNEGLLEGLRQSGSDQKFQFAPPPEEKVQLRCMWAAEFYTPSHTDSLAKSLKDFDQATQPNGSDSANLISWFNGTQRHLQGGSAISLGIWAPKGRPSPSIFNTRTVGLPDPVEYASGMMFSVSPTLTCIVIRFVFDEDMSDRYDAILKSDRETLLTPTASGSQIHFPMTQKRDEIWWLRSELAELAETWFRQNIPGVFSSSSHVCEIPTCEFVTFREAKPFPASDDAACHSYLSLLGVGHDWNAWEYSNVTGLRFGFHDPAGQGPRHYATLAINLMDWCEVNPNPHGQDVRSSLLHSVNLPIQELMSVWAMVPLLQGFAENLIHIQNTTSFRDGGSQKHIEVLRNLTDHVTGLSDISAVSADLAEGDRDGYRPSIWGGPFIPVRPERYQSGTTLNIVLWSSVLERAKWLRSADRNIRDRLSQIGALVGAWENVRLQNKISTLTRVILIVTVLALGATIFGTMWEDWFAAIATQFTEHLGEAWASRPWRSP